MNDEHWTEWTEGDRYFVRGSIGGFEHTAYIDLPQEVGGFFGKLWRGVKKVAKKVAKSKVFKGIAKQALNVAAGVVPGGRTALDALRVARQALRGSKSNAASAARQLRSQRRTANRDRARLRTSRYSRRLVPRSARRTLAAAAPLERISTRFREQLIRELVGTRRR